MDMNLRDKIRDRTRQFSGKIRPSGLQPAIQCPLQQRRTVYCFYWIHCRSIFLVPFCVWQTYFFLLTLLRILTASVGRTETSVRSTEEMAASKSRTAPMDVSVADQFFQEDSRKADNRHMRRWQNESDVYLSSFNYYYFNSISLSSIKDATTSTRKMCRQAQAYIIGKWHCFGGQNSTYQRQDS